MEYIEFFLFSIIAFGVPIAFVCLKNRNLNNQKERRPILESGIPQKLRVTNKHKNTFYPIALMMVFTFVPLTVMLPVFVMRHDGVVIDKLLFGAFNLLASFVGYVIFRFSGGFDEAK